MKKLSKIIVGSVILSFSFLYVATSKAEEEDVRTNTNEDIVFNGKNYFNDCSVTKNKALCLLDQAKFLKDLQNAYTGDQASLERVSNFLWKGGNPSNSGGIGKGEARRNNFDACDFATVALQLNPHPSERQKEETQLKCSDPFEVDLKNITHIRKMNEIKHTIKSHSVHPVK